VTEQGWALVTGAGRRIGRAQALAAAQSGYDVVVHFQSSAAEAAETAALIKGLGRKAITSPADLSDLAACRNLVDRAPAPLRLLVNSASVFRDNRIETLSADDWNQSFSVNLGAPVWLSQAFAKTLPTNESGLIVNICDQRVWRLNPQFFSYTLAKAALWTATQTLAQGLAPRIRVNAIGPGPTLSSIHQAPGEFAAEAAAVPLGRGPHPEEIAAALRYLIDAASVTGQMIAVDGGQHLAWRTPDVADG
jgi:NAD(P)-dependent dehydrogenase (short-subunit alcohol dehydrogenase family)